jgi:tryptophan-rich sensory protein
LQLVLNGAWSYLMFGQKQINSALFDMSALWLVILAFIVIAWPIRRSAALLFVPYFLWVSFAAALNFEIWRLNA